MRTGEREREKERKRKKKRKKKEKKKKKERKSDFEFCGLWHKLGFSFSKNKILLNVPN